MKSNLTFLMLPFLLLAACVPVLPAQSVSPGLNPVSVGECLITPHNYVRQDNNIPMAALVNTPGSEELSLIWRDGSSLGTWQTKFMIPRTSAHIAGPVSGGIDGIPLIYLGSGENGFLQLNIILGNQVTLLTEFPPTVIFTGLIGLPGLPVLAFSTAEPLQDGSSVRSQIFLGDYQTVGASSPILSNENSESRINLPVAIHRDINNIPDGLWYTMSLLGIGGDSLVDPREGLYYLDLITGKSLEFLSRGCKFSDLSTGQNWAAWTSDGVMYAADLHSGETISFPRLAENDRGPVHAFIGPGDGYVVWLEGNGSEWDSTLETTLRIGTLTGNVIGEYPLASFVAPSGLGKEIAIMPLGWMALENYNVVLLVYNASLDQAVLLNLDANTGQISFLSEVSDGGFAGFGYP